MNNEHVLGHKDIFVGHKDFFVGHKDIFVGHKDILGIGRRRRRRKIYSCVRPREAKLITWSKINHPYQFGVNFIVILVSLIFFGAWTLWTPRRICLCYLHGRAFF